MSLGSNAPIDIKESDIKKCVLQAQQRLDESPHNSADIEKFIIDLMRAWARKYGRKPIGILDDPEVTEIERSRFINSDIFWQSAQYLNIYSPIELFFYILSIGFTDVANENNYNVIECAACLIIFSANQNNKALYPSVLRTSLMLSDAKLEAKKHVNAEMMPKYISALEKEKTLKQNAQAQKKIANVEHGDKIRMIASELLKNGVSKSDLVTKTWKRLNNQYGIQVTKRTVRRHIEKMTAR